MVGGIYMIIYRGKYRTSYEMDLKTGKPLEACFIKCKKNITIYRHNESILSAYIPSRMKLTYILKTYPNLFTPFQIGDREGSVLFDESNIEDAAIILGAMVQGKNVSPRSKRNRITKGGN
jgi:hypothetical protein